jgi:quercetin dioxygenase-like cupin family protein
MSEPKESPTMPAAPLDRTIADSNTGETITFLETAAESSVDRVVMRLALAPGTVVRPHAHPTEEAFECQEGTVEFQLDGHPIELRPGSTVTVPPNRIHGLHNASDQPAFLGIVATPGAEAEFGLRLKFLMSRDGYIPVPGSGPPKNVLLGAVVIQRGGIYFPPLPRWLFRLLMGSLATLGRWRGREQFLRDRYPEYALFLDALEAKAARTRADP